MHNPGVTYRIQFHKDFTLADFEAIIPYLRQLGVQTVYASPLLAATAGSTHGYDGINPDTINPEIGTEEDLRRIHRQLSEHGIGWLQDIVPNHMAYAPANNWLMDVLEKGRASEYAGFFDILWAKDDRLMAPFLGGSLEEVIEQDGLRVVEEGRRKYFDYAGNRFPLNAESYSMPGNPTPEDINGNKAVLHELAGRQHYRLCHWQETDRQINYRRFFTVNGLICLNIQDPWVFARYHQYIQQLLEGGLFTGLRIDHVDGLYDPTAYLEQLRELAGPETYIVVEKILEPGEALPRQWPIQGNTGYDFLSLVNNLLTNNAAERAFNRFYKRMTEEQQPVAAQLQDKKAHILEEHMQGELSNLHDLFVDSALTNGAAPDPLLRDAIGAVLIGCPVYRYYGNSLPLDKAEAAALEALLSSVARSKPDLAAAIGQLHNALLAKPLEGDEDFNQRALHFYQRLMQFTGPLMAKGVEDTLMYTYNHFIGHNDVGDSPETFGLTKEAFHQAMLERQAQWPHSLNATSTHDTKRGEGVRARLNVLTDLPEEWMSAVKEWQALNADLKTDEAPDANDEYLIYQTLIGAYPFTETEATDFEERLKEYLTKALREAKVHTDWAAPNEAYEQAAVQFATGLLDKSRPFWTSFERLLERITDFAITNSLAQLLLKCTCPGVPDIYQGTELWDLSLVDPDNRRPVDYDARKALLESLNTGDEQVAIEQLWIARKNAQIKLWLMHRLLQERLAHQALFANGHYVPLRTAGAYKEHLFAFARRLGREWIIVAIPMHPAALCTKQQCTVMDIDWKDTHVVLRPEAPQEWTSLLDGSKGKAEQVLPAIELFQSLPLAFLKMQQPENERSAGLLLGITSLPSAFGIGDMGPEAYAFARALSRSCQGYWQLLPMNPVSAGSAYSPYSSVSTMAGNILLISPERLVEDGLLDEAWLQQHRTTPKNKIDYEAVEQSKRALLDAAYEQYRRHTSPTLSQSFRAFKEKEKQWLTDYALYLALRDAYNGKPWYEWPDAVRNRDAATLEQLREQHAASIEQTAWEQFIFSRQWEALRSYCNGLGIKLFGDLPFYASYDSADVWMHPELFSVDADGKMTGVAGVPPDYFSETGQHWGMPTFNWAVHKSQKYQWWIERLRKNLELYDVLRIDHFRALAGYWEVPAGEETAVNGQWLKGPGTDFFNAVREAFGGLPFIAEDLGYEMEDVYALRDEVGLPGMKVLQFAFGENMQESVDAPHNYSANAIAYTGTHDNNTTLGWYRRETGPDDRARLEQYTAQKVSERNVAEVMMRVVYASVAKTAIIPVQDVLGLNETSRMNTPSSAGGNWGWRLLPGQLTEKHETWLREMARLYNRC